MKYSSSVHEDIMLQFAILDITKMMNSVGIDNKSRTRY